MLKIPTIGIGSSINCDGQILVTDDVLGLTNSQMKFVKKFVDGKKLIIKSRFINNNTTSFPT